MTSIAPQVPTIEVRFSVQGLVDLVNSLNEAGELSKNVFEATSTSIIKNWRYSKKNKASSKEPSKSSGKASSKKETSKTGNSEKVKSLVEKKGNAEKLSGLKKLAIGVGSVVNVTVFSEYTSDANMQNRHALEAKWLERFAGQAAGGKIDGEMVKEFMNSCELSKTEINLSRSYFPKLQTPSKPKAKMPEVEAAPAGEAAHDEEPLNG